MTADAINIHATGLELAGTGIVLRGPSGSGKSLLALELLERATMRGEPGFLVADDRLEILRAGDRLVMRAPKAIAGLIELRDDDRAVILGLLDEAAAKLRAADHNQQLVLWRRRGRRAFAQDCDGEI